MKTSKRETESSLTSWEHQEPSKSALKLYARIVLHTIIIILVLRSFFVGLLWYAVYTDTPTLDSEGECYQAEPLYPTKTIWNDIGQNISSEAFRTRAVKWLGGAVRVPTESFDDMGPVGEDTRWEIHASMHQYLQEVYPLIYSKLQVEKVNTYGQLLTWQGSDASLKPILLMAHEDVVPVDRNTVNEWTHPPFSGHFDGQYIWGRGSSDDKSGLIGTLSAIQLLLEANFEPTRTIVFAVGFDEEVGGYRGAAELAKVVIERYGEDSFAFIVDEGGGFTEQYGTFFAAPGIAEKGSVNVRIDVASPGGHSSVPPSHTSIGILSALLVHLEENPFDVHISRSAPTYGALQCFAEYGRDIDKSLRKAILKSSESDKALHQVEKELFKNKVYKSLVGTTQAIDMIGGGVKTNALPENAWAIVNHRISTESNADETKERDTKLLKDLARKFNLTYTAFGSLVSEADAPSSGSLELSSTGFLNPAPVSPTDKDSGAWNVLSGSIRATFRTHRAISGDVKDDIVVSPGMPTGNTDTRYYWALTNNIYRYTHANLGKSDNALGNGVHTVNEHLAIDSLLETVRFFTTLILNADESSLI